MTAKEILEEDVKGLETATGLKVQVAEQDNRLFVLVREYSPPKGVSRLEKTDVLFIADLQYPLSAMDMFWADVGVVRSDGSLFENSEQIEEYLNRKWRRFSYHRNGVWNPVGNPLLDHFSFMESRWTGRAKQ